MTLGYPAERNVSTASLEVAGDGPSQTFKPYASKDTIKKRKGEKSFASHTPGKVLVSRTDKKLFQLNNKKPKTPTKNRQRMNRIFSREDASMVNKHMIQLEHLPTRTSLDSASLPPFTLGPPPPKPTHRGR